ncbi:MAG: hypothetical protein H0U40_02345 [Chloroflexia bacterium]|nr:hypothetical protein [Chloroflexia bacterium]
MSSSYVWFTVAMCSIVLVSLGLTAYLAAHFNRGAKRDLTAALTPLADLLGGTVDLETASVDGRYRGHLAAARMANASDGPGRVFQAEIVDAAGGDDWQATSTRRAEPEDAPPFDLHGGSPGLAADLAKRAVTLLPTGLDPRRDRFRIEYAATAGLLRLTRPMRSRRDIPGPDDLAVSLDLLVQLGPLNRAVQGAPDAEWAGGRLPHSRDGTSGVVAAPHHDGSRPG